MLCRVAICIVVLTSYVLAQSTPVGRTSAAPLIHNSLSTLTHGLIVTDVTLTGTVRRAAGADDETGAIVAHALATGESQIEYAYNSGRRSESRTVVSGNIVEKWAGVDGAEHKTVPHNVTALSPWFFPPLLLQEVDESPSVNVADVGTEKGAGQAVEHVTLAKQVPALHHPAMMLALLKKAARMELFIDSSTHLPISFTYNAHPDKNLAQDIPVEIRFSDYRSVDGVQIPFHIKKYFNRTLELDIHLTGATLNSGLSVGSLQLH